MRAGSPVQTRKPRAVRRFRSSSITTLAVAESACGTYIGRENKTGTERWTSRPGRGGQRASLMEHFPNIGAVMVPLAVEGPYSYRVPPGMRVVRGSIVAVPLVGRLYLGVVWGPPDDMVAHNR